MQRTAAAFSAAEDQSDTNPLFHIQVSPLLLLLVLQLSSFRHYSVTYHHSARVLAVSCEFYRWGLSFVTGSHSPLPAFRASVA